MRQTNVLIADDDPIVRMDLRTLVTQLGHTVIGEAENGTQVLALARSLRPDLVLLDVLMPALSGLDVARLLAAEGLAAVLLFTGVTDYEIIRQLDECGAMGFLSKPLRDTDLRFAIPIAVARFRERVALQNEIRSLNERMEARKLVGRAKAILMEQHRLSEREAFRRIQGQSQALNKPAHEIAQAIITASELAFGTPRKMAEADTEDEDDGAKDTGV
ncbi:MAG: response regulator [Armatimonadaceae bacterium]